MHWSPVLTKAPEARRAETTTALVAGPDTRAPTARHAEKTRAKV